MHDTAPNGGNSRRLMAIMFTDIKGYSSMMGADEGRTVELVLEHREIVRACISAHDGHEHETIGDAFVVLFESVVNAVRCAIELQKKLAERNQPLDEEKHVWIRIGVHLGDIILRDGGIYGDAVNMAARVQDRGQPGGVCITEQVKMHLGGRIDVPLESMGRVPLKGIRQPPELFRLALPSAQGPVATPAVTESAAVGRKLALAAAALAVCIGVAFAISADFGAATPQRAGVSAAEQKPAKSKVKTPRKAAPNPPEAVVAAAAAKAAPAPTVRDKATAVADERRLASELVTAARAESGQERLRLLEEAVRRDPDNAAYQLLLAQSKRQLAAAASKKRKTSTKRRPRPARAVPAKPAAARSATAKPKITRHVVED